MAWTISGASKVSRRILIRWHGNFLASADDKYDGNSKYGVEKTVKVYYINPGKQILAQIMAASHRIESDEARLEKSERNI